MSTGEPSNGDEKRKGWAVFWTKCSQRQEWDQISNGDSLILPPAAGKIMNIALCRDGTVIKWDMYKRPRNVHSTSIFRLHICSKLLAGSVVGKDSGRSRAKRIRRDTREAYGTEELHTSTLRGRLGRTPKVSCAFDYVYVGEGTPECQCPWGPEVRSPCSCSSMSVGNWTCVLSESSQHPTCWAISQAPQQDFKHYSIFPLIKVVSKSEWYIRSFLETSSNTGRCSIEHCTGKRLGLFWDEFLPWSQVLGGRVHASLHLPFLPSILKKYS